MSYSVCILCGKTCSNESFSVDPGDFYAGRKIRFVQGDWRRAGKLGIILRPFSVTMFPGLYVADLDGHEVRVRWDHCMFDDRLQSDIHYRELYEQRMLAANFQYKEYKV